MDNDVTPVYLAAQEGHLEVLKFLVTEAGGSLYVRAKDGMAPVHAASQMGCLSCLKWMIQEQGVDPNLRDGDGATPLHFAASRGHVETVRWLLRHGARLVLDKFGKSPINDAAENQQMECLNILVQHGATPDYPEVVRHKPPPCSCCKGESQSRQCTSEPFYLHPPAQQPDGLYINPAHHSATAGSGGGNSDPFYLHNPRDLVYTRVKDLFDCSGGGGPPQPPLTVKAEVHSSSSGAGSDENLSSSDLSERSADPENDYEEIYQSREEKAPPRRRSRDSGSHSRSSSTSARDVVVTAPPPPPEPSMTASTDLGPVSMLDDIISSYDDDDDDEVEQESGVSSGSPSDLDDCGDKAKVSHRHSLPHPVNARAPLKRVVSEPGSACPPPPPPPPPADEGNSRSATPEQQQQQPPEEEVKEERDEGEREEQEDKEEEGGGTPRLVNKQLALPFIPPRFPSLAADSNSLIKPSEYLRSLGGITTLAPQPQPVPQQPQPQPTLPPAAAGPPPPPLPDDSHSDAVKKQQQPLGAISIQDLNSVQLRRTDKMLAAKTLSAPPQPGHHLLSRPPHGGEQPFLVQKEDLIAELKMSKDITGIKKMKVERAKVEEQQEKQMFSEISRQLTVNSFVEKQIPEKDATGNPIPAWKRQMMAKKAADRARKELEEQMLKEAEEKRLQAIPPWKRQLLAKKEEMDTRKTNLYTPRVVDDKKSKPSKPEEVARQQLPDDEAPTSAVITAAAEDGNKENKTPEQQEQESAQIIPWRAQLRKTNSKLSLLE